MKQCSGGGEAVALRGRYVSLIPLDPAVHAERLYAVCHGPGHEDSWRFLRDGPFADVPAYRAHLEAFAGLEGVLPFVIMHNGSGDVVGKMSLMRYSPTHRSVEIGYVLFVPVLRNSRGGTEAIYLAARYAFEDLGCRRCEWRSDAANQASARAALRLGFQREGVLRQHMVVKARSRDTAVFSLLDAEWPARKAALDAWLEPSNFDAEGRQIAALKRSDASAPPSAQTLL
ncbi:N-acetyltransferase [Trinickia dinghuensis]|uniref:N-acetyltransferase n=2 Tax=Trinickia dinghuensis TaxID=2291023 RepID=A0A3D8JY33_9BURK|nr:N-acetyltransferase [Trinickia dinghuensis]